MMRSSGVLMHLTSLPSPHGIGTMGAEAQHFVNFLAAAGQTWWQLLPICPTSFGDSPYQTFSTFAGNPYLIDLPDLASQGLLKPEEYEGADWGDNPARVDYARLYQWRYLILRKACGRFWAKDRACLERENMEYTSFCNDNVFWLEDYALFMSLKEQHGGAPWSEWEEPLRFREPSALAEAKEKLTEELIVWKTVQFFFFRQWRKLKAYAKEKGVALIGDLPIYVSFDSVDVWAAPGQFQLDEELHPTEVAGCPPDGFCADGQLWGNPLFRWEVMERDNFAWWVRRMEYQCRLYDRLRVDHFRGFDSYYAIPYGEATARNGQWREGPGMKLFKAVERAIGRQELIAEDLGFLTPSVRKLLADSGFPGMKVLEFAFDSQDGDGSDYLPHNYEKHCVAYTGTHDNEPVLGWLAAAPCADVAYAKEYLRMDDRQGPHWAMMRGIWASVADTAIVQMQDLLGLGHAERMNEPSTLGKNWRWRALPGFDSPELAEKLHHETAIYCRMPRLKEELS